MVALMITALLVINGQKQAKSEDREEPDLSQFPTLDYKNRNAANLSEKQKKSSKKYNTDAPVITENDTSIFLSSDWSLRLPALPVKISAAVIIGEVTEAQAHFSSDQTNVYSEFAAQISDVLKNDYKAPLGVGNSVVLERSGGQVRFPSGKVMVSATNGQDMPRVGKRYLFFLTHEGPDAHVYEDFLILTGYELRDGLVFPLDKGGRGYAAYKEASETLLLNDLAVALADSFLSPPNLELRQP
jgi:nitrate reductase cytochrome c-type subunit